MKLYRNEVPQVSGSLLGGDVVIQFVRSTKAAEEAARRAQPGQGSPALRASVLTGGRAGRGDAARQSSRR